MKKKSNNKKVNNKGRELVKLLGEIGGYILNEIVEGDKEREFTYVDPRGNSVIDFIVTNKSYKNVNSFKLVGWTQIICPSS